MVDYAWFNNLISQPYDCIFVDEAQDANEAQLDLIARHTHKDSRIIFVGDRNQAIYAFRGGDNNSIDRIIVRFNPENFIMPISYRNSKAVVRKVNELLPHIEHYAAENAIEGLTADIDQTQFTNMVKAGDMVLCKHNAPLIKPAWQLISKGIKAVIIGKNIGSNMSDLIKKFDEGNIDETLDNLQQHKTEKARKLNAAGKFAESELFTDIADSAINLLFELSSVEKALKFIDDIFSETRSGVSFSSIHKAKGLESQNVFILHPELLKTGSPTIEDKNSQEYNVTFVGLTRAIENMYFVTA
jgi:superfamily I DNA/RNA helicase